MKRRRRKDFIQLDIPLRRERQVTSGYHPFPFLGCLIARQLDCLHG
jgi:hypothetical protein